MRRFEYVAGSSSRFWQIERRGRDVVAGWGRIGTAGQRKSTTFKTDAEAKAQLDKQVRSKLGEGYVETGGKPVKPVKAAPVSSGDALKLIALHARALAALAASDEVDAPKPAKPTPIAASKLRAWEARYGVTLPADFVALLTTHGRIELAWWFRTHDGAGYDLPTYDLDVHMPAFDSYRRDPTYPAYNDVAWFASEDGNNTSWGFRLRPGALQTIVCLRYKQEPVDIKGSFTEWLSDKLTFFGRKEAFPKSARTVKRGDVASLATLARAMRLTAPSTMKRAPSTRAAKRAPTPTLPSLCSSIKIHSGVAEVRFREDAPANASLAGLLPADLASLHLIDCPAQLDLGSIATLGRLYTLKLTIRAPDRQTPALLRALGAGAQKFRAVKALEIRAPWLDDTSFARAFPSLKTLKIFVFNGAIPADLSSVCAPDLTWYGVEPDVGSDPVAVKGRVGVPATLALSPRLEKLSLLGLDATQLPVIHGGSALEMIAMSGGRIATADLAAFAGSSGTLETVEVDDAGVVEIHHLERLKAIKTLTLIGNKLTTLARVAGLARLRGLTLMVNPLRDFAWMAELSHGCGVSLSESLPPKVKNDLVASHGKRLALEWR